MTNVVIGPSGRTAATIKSYRITYGRKREISVFFTSSLVLATIRVIEV